ncbi:hypothetical protein GMOD_00010004 [Pyrenophora seminiperda CCB06]|uniref:Uncharacterized protein n=1 Tax=Pyrenophora seminiperda CCB06 TaxID=1302712 RepID=A0A3M7M1M4_9PLEO|nr:hypothetical protein GMOD_00010004 [Pyrenophora seminiperda CCB06]
MSRIACVWSKLGDDEAVPETNTWYENTHVPDALAKIKSTARIAEQVEDNAFKEIPQVEGNLMTIYDLPCDQDAAAIDTHLRPSVGRLPKEARIDTRVYTEHQNWFGDEWRDDHRDVRMWIVVLWQPLASIHDEFIEWFQGEFLPGMLQSPELLRTRVFKLDHASLVSDRKHATVDKESVYQYMTLWEFDSEELPWEVLIYLGSSERWRYYAEGQLLNWQIGQFLVNKIYPEIEDADSPIIEKASILVTAEYQDEVEDDDENDSHKSTSNGSETEHEDDESEPYHVR